MYYCGILSVFFFFFFFFKQKAEYERRISDWISDVCSSDLIRAMLAGQDGGRLKAMAFRHGETQLGAALLAARGRKLYVAGRVKRDDWGTRPQAEMHLDDAAWAD